MVLQEACIAEEVLLDLRAGGHVSVYDTLRIELKAAHNETHCEPHAVASSSNHQDFQGHHLRVDSLKLFCKGTILVELGLKVNLAVLMETCEVRNAIKVCHTFYLRILIRL